MGNNYVGCKFLDVHYFYLDEGNKPPLHQRKQKESVMTINYVGCEYVIVQRKLR